MIKHRFPVFVDDFHKDCRDLCLIKKKKNVYIYQAAFLFTFICLSIDQFDHIYFNNFNLALHRPMFNKLFGQNFVPILMKWHISVYSFIQHKASELTGIFNSCKLHQGMYSSAQHVKQVT